MIFLLGWVMRDLVEAAAMWFFFSVHLVGPFTPLEHFTISAAGESPSLEELPAVWRQHRCREHAGQGGEQQWPENIMLWLASTGGWTLGAHFQLAHVRAASRWRTQLDMVGEFCKHVRSCPTREDGCDLQSWSG
ncbi:Synaptonemal complex protein 1 [Platysternon megacephalum]|uniref:Synaptonemal complex protein 1 n=1 Tax=Platysternon megacephalum TaxID=55544 RepID=A0A4D9EXP0_9SAUR|nr:Synaptonemal complex protein 1 [Platysternon megacephalum]